MTAAEDGFLAHDFSAPLDVEAHLAQIPADLRVRAFFIHYILDLATKRGTPVQHALRLHRDSDIALRDSEGVLIEAARVLEPDVPLREAIRRVSRLIYPALLSSPVGRVVFGVAAHVPAALIRLTPAGYRMAGTRARATVVTLETGHAVIAVENSVSLVESSIGSTESSLMAGGHTAEILVRRQGPTAFDLDVRWYAAPK